MSYRNAIQATTRRVIVHHDWGATQDIMAAIMAVINKDDLQRQVAPFVLTLGPDKAGRESQKAVLRRIWQICRREIKYKEDPRGVQQIKHPARLWADKTGDCKSLTVFIFMCCRALDIPCFIRFASYTAGKQIGHVYPLAVVDGMPVAVDAVWHRFDDEERSTYYENHLPAVFAGDPGLQRLAKTSAPNKHASIGNVDVLPAVQKAMLFWLAGWLTYKIAT